MERPGTITATSVIIIMWAAVSLLGAILLLIEPEARALIAEQAIAPILLFTAPLLMLISGFAILKGRNWGRVLFLIWGILNFGLGLVFTPFEWQQLVPIAIFLAIVFFLFRPEASAYFRQTGALTE